MSYSGPFKAEEKVSPECGLGGREEMYYFFNYFFGSMKLKGIWSPLGCYNIEEKQYNILIFAR